MSEQKQELLGRRVDVCTLEADMAFFDARISLAAEAPDTVYQRAQIKAYRTLGRLLGDTLEKVRPAARKKRPSAAA